MMRYLMFTVLFALSLLPSPALAADPPESEEEEARERAERSAPPGGFRQGKIIPKEVGIYLDGKKIGTVTHEQFQQFKEKRIFSPRGPKKGWLVMDAIQAKGIKTAKTVRFISQGGKQLDLDWNDLTRFQNTVVFTYNFNGELILETDVSEKVPDHLRDSKEDEVREEMHKARKKSLIFMRNVERIEVLSN